jgi:hypothetical protein
MILLEVLEKAYHSEINIEISSFWDNGWTVSLGDHMNGYKETDILVETNELADTIHKMILKHYPTSDYAKKYPIELLEKETHK